MASSQPPRMRAAMTPRQALAFVRRHGIVLESGRGPVPSLAEAIAGGPIRGSWWAHPLGKAIFEATRAVRDAKQVLVCRVALGKVTYVHERVWPALVRLAPLFPKASLASIREEHTASGRHVTRSVPFPRWVTPALRAAGARLDEAQARRTLGPLLEED